MPLLSAVVAILSSSPLLAQVENRQHIEEEKRREMEALRKTREEYEQPFVWDVGAWLNFTLTHYDDEPDREDRTLRLTDLRIWGEARIYDDILFYLRLRNQYIDWNSGDQYSGDDNDLNLTRLDQLYFDLRLNSLVGSNDRLNLRLGRQYVDLGRGVLLNNVSDGILVEMTTGKLAGKLVATRSNPAEQEIDQSRPDEDHMKRLFLGLDVAYLGIDPHRIYLLGMAQIDLNPEDPSVAGQEFDYDSFYVGLGSRGSIFPQLSYHLEGIYEFGESAASGSDEKEDIRAWSLTASLFYKPALPLQPLVTLEYYFGSGDPERASVTNSIGGNEEGTDDEGFVSFGYLMTGYALFPRLSNLHIVKASVMSMPLSDVELFRTLQVGAAYYLYRKDEDSGGISDSKATLEDSDIGMEVDAVLRWRPFSDLGFSVNYGVFFPGDAYDDDADDPRNYLDFGITYSF